MPNITIVTPAATADLTTLANVKAWLNISGSSEDTFLQTLITAASAAIEAYLGHTVSQETISEFLPGTGERNLVLTRAPISSITYIKLDGTILESTDYEILDAKAGILLHKYGVWTFDGYGLGLNYNIPQPLSARNNYEVRYVAGFATVPKDLEMAVISHIRTLYAARNRDTSIQSEAVSGVYSVTYGKTVEGFASDVLSVLNNYKLYAI